MALFRCSSGGGGGANLQLDHNTTQITFSDNTTYHYIGEGKFVYANLARGSVSTAPVLQVFKKNSDGTYTAVSNAVSTTATGVSVIKSSESILTDGSLYIKKNSGTNFTTSSFDCGYLVEA